jgi:RHS repeat-associated protein
VEQRDPLGNSRLIAPDAAGRPVGFTDALGFSSSTEYTPVDQPAASVDPLGGRTGFAYDAAGRLASVTDARGTVLERYGYDALDRLLTRTDALGKEERYAYNAGGQLTRRTDRQGRVTTYGYDGSGRLIRIEHPEGTVQQRSYDPLGRRSERRVNGQSTRYVYDGAQAIGEIREGQSTTLLTSLSIDEMLARYSAQGARSFLTDALGSVIALTREDQSVLTSYAYSPYGQSQTSGAEEGNASQYTARENDGTGLYYYRARYYDAVLKRFTQPDPIGLAGGINAYGYVEGNPVLKRDPLGLESWGPFGPEPGVVFPPSTPNPDPQGEYFRKPAELWDALKKDCMARCVYELVVPGLPEVATDAIPRVANAAEVYVTAKSASSFVNEAMGVFAATVTKVATVASTVGNIVSGFNFLRCMERCKRCGP